MIRVLPEDLVNKIAAGEVIVRPASAVKELVENSIDADAQRVWVEVSNGCRDLRVRDDGCGMERADAELALVRHSTSKITTFDELWALPTRGFRGEALASIASVSRLQILTRRRGEVAGTRVTAEGAGAPLIESAGAPEGSDVRVRDLFFNTPARLKFMKSPAAELQQILASVVRQAMIRPEIGFAVLNEKDTLIDCPPGQDWGERVAMLLGSGIHENLLQVALEREGYRLRGFIVKPSVTRKDRRQQFFYVNGRPVTSRSLSFVVQEAYRGLIMVQRFPVVVLDIAVPAGEVDINVHPTKEEVRFRNESRVNGLLHRGVQDCLRRANLMPEAQLDAAPSAPAVPGVQGDVFGAVPPDLGRPAGTAMPGDFSRFTSHVPAPSVPLEMTQPLAPGRSDSALLRQVDAINRAEHEFDALVGQMTPPADTTEPTEEAGECSVRPVALSLRRVPEAAGGVADASALIRSGQLPEPVCQVARCYIVAQCGDDLLLIDQHAAHERILYLKFSDRSRSVATQSLLIPVSVDVPAQSLAFMQRLLPIFQGLGLAIEPFGGQTFVVQSMPADLEHLDPAAVVADLLDDFESLGKVSEIEVLRDRVITRMACRSAVKAGQALHREEMRALIRDIIAARLAFTCPHGRPTMILLTRDQLDRQFKRKV